MNEHQLHVEAEEKTEKWINDNNMPISFMEY